MNHYSTAALRGLARSLLVPALLSIILPGAALAQMEDKSIEATDLGAGIFMLTRSGGNIGLSVGDDATFIIDDQFAPLTDKIVAAIAAVSDRPVDYVLNTHWHYDHTGGNENFGERGALIMAHDNVHKRMAAGQFMAISGRTIDPAPAAALPVITFNDVLTLHTNGQTITGTHVHHAHTDGDILERAEPDTLVGFIYESLTQ